ncbi:MAG TPA: FkbM family methyltransferase [Acidimicrobiia bacterium]|nr:FkbM family methyltransferase [Acidimicrobiia bacterium]
MTPSRRWIEVRLDGERQLRVRLPDDAWDPIAEELAAGTWRVPWVLRLVLDVLDAAEHDGADRVLLDVGAHLGTVSLAAAGRGARVVAVEASTRNATCLAASAAVNRLDVTLLHAAAADRPQVLQFHEDGPYGQVVADGGVTVEADTLPALLSRARLDRATLVKIDVEGHEPAVLAGAAPLFSRADAPDVICEGNGYVLLQGGHTTGELAGTLQGFGYRVFLVGDHELVPFAPTDLPPANVVDLFATKHAATPWPVRAPLTPAECASMLTRELLHPVHTHRCWAAQALADAPRTLLAHREISEALEACAHFDAVPEVRAAAAWWPGRRVEIATDGRIGSARTLATIAAQWSAVADDAAVLTRRAAAVRRGADRTARRVSRRARHA